jgi:glycyl-tRNA synthetase beta chain
MSADFLVEIGTEELPPKALFSLSQAFREELVSQFSSYSLYFKEAEVFATPRRLAVLLKDLDEQAPNKDLVVWGPPAKIAFDANGRPTAAAQAFAVKNHLPIGALSGKIENDGTQDKLCHRTNKPGQKTSELAGSIIEAALAALPVPKKMRWGANPYEFVRPIHWVLVLFGENILPVQIMGLTSSNTSQGHRFHSRGDVVIASPASYKEALRGAFVIADFSERKELIRSGVSHAAIKAGGIAVIDEPLLDEVAALTEWPVPLLGRFEERFLVVPPEVLVSSMTEHQKYFHVKNKTGELLPFFVTVSNINSEKPLEIISGNERVIRPRLADAAFFYDTDKKTTLAEKRALLKPVIFQEKLGSVYDKTERLAGLAQFLAPIVGADVSLSVRAAELSKSDLVSEMVGEFEGLQGVMGRYYAINDGEHPEVAEALLEQYMPRFAGDALPLTATGAVLALADRLDTLVGIFGVGQPPSGSKDPFALRRASLGLLKIIIGRKIDIDLYEALSIAASQYGRLAGSLAAKEDTIKQVLTYVIERFKSWYEDEKISTEVFLSVAARNLKSPLEIHLRVNAVHCFSVQPEAAALAAANKRVSNILVKQGAAALSKKVKASLLVEPSEVALAELLIRLDKQLRPLLNKKSYTEALKLLSQLKGPVDNFFDNVMVMADNQDIRNNRLVLLRQLRNLFLEVADISLLAPSNQDSI